MVVHFPHKEDRLGSIPFTDTGSPEIYTRGEAAGLLDVYRHAHPREAG